MNKMYYFEKCLNIFSLFLSIFSLFLPILFKIAIFLKFIYAIFDLFRYYNSTCLKYFEDEVVKDKDNISKKIIKVLFNAFDVGIIFRYFVNIVLYLLLFLIKYNKIIVIVFIICSLISQLIEIFIHRYLNKKFLGK